MRTAIAPVLTGLMVLLFSLFVLAPGSANAIALPNAHGSGLIARFAEAAGSASPLQLTKRKGGKGGGGSSKGSKGKKKISGGVIAAIIIVVIVVILIVAVLLFLRARKAKKAQMPH
ncbi:MAG: hypothetical protein M1814_000100 [Vezdaea aestivalis]|nr:MAG: hypothetical protein M1814_000100 [Vezdaea aestivalis]